MAVLGLLCAGLPALAQAPATPRILACTDAQGRPIVSDRPTAACADRDVTVRGSDGSRRGTLRAAPTAEEQARIEQAQREEDELIRKRNVAVRNDRLLLQKFPDEAAHRKARESALDERRRSIASLERRLGELAVERKPLEQEREFYPPPKTMPFKLKNAIEANDATAAGVRDAIANQQAEIARVNASYDRELVRLKRLWGGAPLGHADPAVTAGR